MIGGALGCSINGGKTRRFVNLKPDMTLQDAPQDFLTMFELKSP
jgi:hypothetical protein